ncbi:MAG: hypothetical protein CME06_04095 [Gemmatimonadetes bacterium]|nr:hypothetical protein [Gemmatimonadota bacterium]
MYGPLTDLLFGCGLLYAILCVVFLFDGGAVFDGVPLAIPALLIALASAPHYGATLVRVYDQRSDRRGYFMFSVVTTIALAAVFGVALFERWIGSIFATVYLTWAGWHYTGQNYGIAAMFLRRRGVTLDGIARRALYTSFTLSYVLVFLVMHGQAEPVADPGIEVRLVPLAIPGGFNELAIPLVTVAYFASTVAWVVLLARRVARFSDLLPTLLISGAQALWWSIPYVARFFDLGAGLVPVDWGSRSLLFPWIACAHSLQYLWITSFYARSSSHWNGHTRYYLSVLTAGSAIWALPALLFAPGGAAFDWNFALLLAATVNLHHFILDGAIWKLRNVKIARILISDDFAGEAEGSNGGRVRIAVWAIAGLGLMLTAHSLAEQFLIEPAALRSGNLEAAAKSLDRQAWLGKNSAFDRFQLGRRFEAAGNPEAAIAQFEISAGLEPRVESIKRLIGHYQRSRNAPGFVRSCDRLFELDSVDRPMPTPELEILAQKVPAKFREACVQTARAARPVAAVPGDPTADTVPNARRRQRTQYGEAP